MQLSLDLTTEFQKLHFKTFGERISLETAELELLNLADLVRITHSHKTEEDENEE